MFLFRKLQNCRQFCHKFKVWNFETQCLNFRKYQNLNCDLQLTHPLLKIFKSLLWKCSSHILSRVRAASKSAKWLTSVSSCLHIIIFPRTFFCSLMFLFWLIYSRISFRFVRLSHKQQLLSSYVFLLSHSI